MPSADAPLARRFVHGARTWGFVDGGFRKLTCPLGHNLKLAGAATIMGDGVLRCRFRPPGKMVCGLQLYVMVDVRNSTIFAIEVDDQDVLKLVGHTTVNEKLQYLGCIPRYFGAPAR